MINERKAEIANSITHGVALFIFAIASIFLLFKGLNFQSSILNFSLLTFITSMCLLYLFSTCYHISKGVKIKKIFRCLDHIGIYVLIAGSYTPFLLWSISGIVGWVTFGILWGLVLIGIVYKSFFLGKYPLFSLLLYLAMGWSVIFISKSFYTSTPVKALIFILIEGFFYTAGTYFFWKDNKHTYYHALWHIFVLFGTLSHFMAVWFLLE